MKKNVVFISSILLVITLFFASVYFVQDLALFHPKHDSESWEFLASRSSYEAVEIETGDKRLHGVMRHTESDKPAPLVLFFYGNGDTASKTLFFIEKSHTWSYFKDYQCLMIDYDGYGLNDGRPSEKSMYEMALEAYDYATALPQVSQVIVGGYSLGTGPAIYVSARRETGGLFLLAPYANGYDLCNGVLPVFYGPLRLLVKNKLPSDEYAKEVTGPVLVVASRSDTVVPFASSERLYDCFDEESTFVALSGIGHGSIFLDQTTLESVKAYLDKVGNSELRSAEN